MRRRLAVLVTLVVAIGVGAWLLRPAPARSLDLAWPSFDLLHVPGVCERPASEPFVPTRVEIPDVLDETSIMALPRDGNDIPGVPPVNAKYAVAWDRPPGIEPGSDRGNVLLNTHTWPDGSALGNVLLAKWDVGDQIILRGKGDVELCYEVTDRVEVRASDGYPPFYDREGPPQVALIVCSGQRTGPGHWTHRTIWFASPIDG